MGSWWFCSFSWWHLNKALLIWVKLLWWSMRGRVSQICGSKAMKCFVCDSQCFKLKPVTDGQPVQNLVELSCVEYWSKCRSYNLTIWNPYKFFSNSGNTENWSHTSKPSFVPQRSETVKILIILHFELNTKCCVHNVIEKIFVLSCT